MNIPAETDNNDPFQVGQFVGMLVILTFIERNNGIPKEFLYQLKAECAEKSSGYLEKPTEDVLLFVEGLVDHMEHK